MAKYRSRKEDLFHLLWQFVKGQIVGDAPDDLAICAFDCRKAQCMQGEWAACQRRMLKGAGELFPDCQFPIQKADPPHLSEEFLELTRSRG